MYERLGKKTLELYMYSITGRVRSGQHIAKYSSPAPPGTGGPHSTAAGTQSIPSTLYILPWGLISQDGQFCFPLEKVFCHLHFLVGYLVFIQPSNSWKP